MINAGPAPLHARRGRPEGAGPLSAYVQALRPGFLLASILPVILGTAWGAVSAGPLDLLTGLVFLMGMVCGHSAGNVLNDVCDDLSGNDSRNHGRITPFTGGSRVIQDDLLSRRQMTGFVVGLLSACAATGVVLTTLHGWPILVFGLAMGALVLVYHLPPLRLNHRGLAEALIGLMFGIAPVLMAVWLQGGRADGMALLLSLPITAWVVNILLINEVPDRAADRSVGKATLIVLLGVRRALWLQAGLDGVAVLALAALMLVGPLPAWAVFAPLALTVAHLVLLARTEVDDRAAMPRLIKVTLALHGAGGLSMTLGLLTGA